MVITIDLYSIVKKIKIAAHWRFG